MNQPVVRIFILFSDSITTSDSVTSSGNMVGQKQYIRKMSV